MKQYKRIKYARPDNTGVVIGDLPSRPIEKAMAGEGLLAQVVIDKYVDHLPLYRQMQRFERAGVKLAYSTLTDWVSNTCNLITPLFEALKSEVMQSGYLHADETPIKVIDKDKKGQTHRGFYWVYQDSINKIVFFDYQEGRGREGPMEILENFKGYLQTDSYAAYDVFDKRQNITLIHCIAHARRMFNETLDNDFERASYALGEIQKLYTIERISKESNLNFEELKIVRNKKADPILKGMWLWMQQKYLHVLPKSAIGKALAYSMLAQQTGSFNSSYGPMQPDQPIEKGYSAPLKTYNMYLSLDKGPFDFKLLHHYAEVPTSATIKPDNGVYNKNVFYGSGVTTANISYADSIGNVRSVTSLQGSFFELNPKSNFRNLYGSMEHGYKYALGSMIKLDEQINIALSRNINVMGGLTYEFFNSIPKSVELAEPVVRNGATEGVLLNSSEAYNPGGIPAKFFHLKYQNVGSFLQGQFIPFKKFAITLGMRYDNNSRFGSTVNPRAGLVYKHSSKTTIKALYGTAYWAPSPHVSFEQFGSFYSLDSGKTYRSSFWHLPNPGLKPTTSQTTEISINQKVSRNLNLTLTGYYTQMKNLISSASDNGNTNLYNNQYLGYRVDYIEVPVNLGTQKSYGGNLMVNSTFTVGNSKFNAWTSISYVNGTITENGPSSKLIEVEIPYVAPWQFRAGIDGHSGDFNYSVRLLHSGKQRVTGFTDRNNPHDRQELSGFTLVNASAGYTWKERFTLFAKMENALNQHYRNAISVDLNDNNSVTFHGSLQNPLRVMAGLTFSLR